MRPAGKAHPTVCSVGVYVTKAQTNFIRQHTGSSLSIVVLLSYFRLVLSMFLVCQCFVFERGAGAGSGVILHIVSCKLFIIFKLRVALFTTMCTRAERR